MIIASFLGFLKPILLKILILFLISISLRLILQFTGQSWIKTTSHTSTLIYLPIVTFVITSVISGNVALSLGMVGALSIVRFRNPVRSPLELTVYFTAIAMGIPASANIKWLVVLAFSIYIILVGLILISIISKRILKKQFFISSFSEGNSLCSLEINASKNIKSLDNSTMLKSKSSIAGKKQYLLVSNSFNRLRDLASELDSNELVIEYNLNQC